MPDDGVGRVQVRGVPHSTRQRIAAVFAVAMLALLLTGARTGVRAAPPNQASGPGESIFQTRCTACHTIGKGKLVGPDLKDVTARRDAAWLKRFIADPSQMFASDPTAQQLLAENNNVKMPTLGLSDAEIASIIAFLGANSGGGGAQAAAPAQQPAPAVAAAGDPVAGWQAFTGRAGLTNGGPGCIACHSVEGLSGLGGGALGPDLTHVAQRYPGPALGSVLGNIAFPTMAGPFANRPLTPQEQANLVAYLTAVDKAQFAAPPTTPGAITQNTGLVLAVGLAGLLALTLLLAIFWPRQRQSVSARLRKSEGAHRGRKPAVR